MSGTTLCPHCQTRFKITDEQLEAHHGMVRCGHCLQAFDAYLGFVPDKPHAQLEFPLLDETALTVENTVPLKAASVVEETNPIGEILHEAAITAPAAHEESSPAASLPETPPAIVEPVAQPANLTLAEQVAIVHDDDYAPISPPPYRKWPWMAALFLLILALLAQSAYFFRVDLAARQPGLKPVLVGYCQLLGCSVPLPQKTGLMSIESSDLEADPTHENQITLNALLRNRAPYAQTFPNLELTLNDTQDKPIARRVFKPADYLPPLESETIGLLSNHELSIKLYLNIADLRPTGYRLVLFYP